MIFRTSRSVFTTSTPLKICNEYYISQTGYWLCRLEWHWQNNAADTTAAAVDSAAKATVDTLTATAESAKAVVDSTVKAAVDTVNAKVDSLKK